MKLFISKDTVNVLRVLLAQEGVSDEEFDKWQAENVIITTSFDKE